MEETKNNTDKNKPINALPEYEIRTMKDDLAGIKPRRSMPSPSVPAAPPEKLPIVPEKPEIKIEEPEIKEEPIKRAPLPSLEQFIAPIPPSPPPVPVVTPKPIVPEKIQPEVSLPEKKVILPRTEKPSRKKFLIVLIIILVLIAIGAFFYWQGKKASPVPQPSPPPQELQIPTSLISVDETKVIKIENNVSFLTLLKNETNSDQPDKTLKRIVPIKGEKEILSLNNLIKELKIAVYPYVLSELKDNYTLVLYSQNGKKRLGLVIEINKSVGLKEQLRFWEKTMAEDLKNLFLNEKPGTPLAAGFHDNAYKETNIRYINFPDPGLTIDYALSDNLLLLAISKDSMYEIINRLKP